MTPRRTSISIGDDNGLAVRSYAQIADELSRRGFKRITQARVSQLCWRAERKLIAAIRADFPELETERAA